jgi:hypothetical protein
MGDDELEGLETRGELRRDAARPAGAVGEESEDADVVIEGDVIVRGDIVLADDTETDDPPAAEEEEGFATEAES